MCVRVFINRPHEALGETWHASVSGVPEAACVLDIAGAIAWISQIATFVQPLGMGILHHRRGKSWDFANKKGQKGTVRGIQCNPYHPQSMNYDSNLCQYVPMLFGKCCGLLWFTPSLGELLLDTFRYFSL